MAVRIRELPTEITDPGAWTLRLVAESPSINVRRNGLVAWRDMTEHWCHQWQMWSHRDLPSPGEAVSQFVETMRHEGDLSKTQIDQLSRTVFTPTDQPLRCWLADATERFVWRMRPWLPLWSSFAQWTMRWCAYRHRHHIIFLARDMLSTFMIARRLQQSVEPELNMILAHTTRSHDGHLSKILGLPPGEDFRGESFALVDSGCYGSVASRMIKRLASDTSSEAACLFYFSRNPRIFGFVNYLMSPTILEVDLRDHRVADFVIYVGDLLEALPKPYRIVNRSDAFRGQIQDLISFSFSMAVLKEVFDYVDAGPPISIDDARRRALELYGIYVHASANRVVGDSLLFHRPAPKQQPSSYGFADLDFHSLPPQNEIFGPVPG